MNPEQFILMMNDLPDAVIDSANSPVVKPKHKIWYMIPAVAACFIALIAAAVYPKLRIQTPEMIEPPESVAEVITATTTAPESTGHSETQTITSLIQTTFASVTVTVNTTASAAVSDVVTETEAETATELPETDTHTVTEPPVITTALADMTEQVTESGSDTTQTVIQILAAVPVWQGEDTHPEMASEPMSEPQIRCRFWLSTSDAESVAGIRKQYGIPDEFDLTKNQCLLIRLETEYADTAVTGGTLSEDGLVLFVACRNQKEPLTYMHFAVPLPEGITVEPESCRAEYQIYEDKTENPKIENPLILISK